MSIKTLNQAGDTIIEVMVVLAILGLSIGISYATAHRSLQNARTAQENAEATSLLQSQLETLRYLAPTLAQPPGYASLGHFCIDPAATSPDATSVQSSSSSTCKGMGNSNLFDVDITYDTGTQSFQLVATWGDVNGSQGLDTVTMAYRPYSS